MRLRIFDWATRKFWVVALWEDRTLRVSFRGPEDGTWFRCWKWEPEWKPKPPNSDPYRYEISFMTADGRVATPPYTSHEQTAPRQDALEAFKLAEQLQGQAVTRQGAAFNSFDEMQRENMDVALNPPGWIDSRDLSPYTVYCAAGGSLTTATTADGFVIPEGANTIAETGGVREFKIPADASAPPMPAPDRVEHFCVDDLIENPVSASAQAASARNWLMKEAALRAKIDAKIDADDLLKYPIESKCVHPVTIGSVQITGDLAAEVLAGKRELVFMTADGHVVPPKSLTE